MYKVSYIDSQPEREMEISISMNLSNLAQRMGNCATIEEAERMRDLLCSDSSAIRFSETQDVPADTWDRLLSKSVISA